MKLPWCARLNSHKHEEAKMTDPDIRRDLLDCLEYQRSSVRSIVGGLAEEAWHKPVVPSGFAGLADDWPWDEGMPPHDPQMAFTCERPSSEVLGYYREVCDRSDEILAGVSLSDVPRGRHRGQEVPSVQGVILHIIEETAAHSGHLEIARELLDGATGLGMR
jgi:Protein of unknown function (DUF664)